METLKLVVEGRGKNAKPVKHLYQRLRRQRDADPWRLVSYYGCFVDWQGVRRKFPLGTDIGAAKEALALYEARNVKREDFDLDKVKPEKTKGMTVAEWADAYFELAEVKQKRSINDDRARSAAIVRHLGNKLWTEIERDDLFRYVNDRRKECIMRNGKQRKTRVSDGTIRNELSLLKRMRNLAQERGIKVSALSFKGVSPSAGSRERVLKASEQTLLFEVMPRWFRWLSEGSLETALSEGDLLRLTESMIDEDQGVVIPQGGRKKTGVRQIAPLTPRFREILQEIRTARKKGEIVPNIRGLVFSRDDGRPITKNQVTWAMAEACRRSGVENFRFHDLRHTAKTRWARAGIPVEAAMLAAGHSSVLMHNQYVHLQAHDIADVFATVNVHKMLTSTKTADASISK